MKLPDLIARLEALHRRDPDIEIRTARLFVCGCRTTIEFRDLVQQESEPMQVIGM